MGGAPRPATAVRSLTGWAMSRFMLAGRRTLSPTPTTTVDGPSESPLSSTLYPTVKPSKNPAWACAFLPLSTSVKCASICPVSTDQIISGVAISHATTDEEKKKIRKKQLGPCIEDHITDAAVRAAAKRATWLGNDETHYVRRWEDKDITDLKNLVRLTVNAVENAILMRQYEKEMPGD